MCSSGERRATSDDVIEIALADLYRDALDGLAAEHKARDPGAYVERVSEIARDMSEDGLSIDLIDQVISTASQRFIELRKRYLH